MSWQPSFLRFSQYPFFQNLFGNVIGQPLAQEGPSQEQLNAFVQKVEGDPALKKHPAVAKLEADIRRYLEGAVPLGQPGLGSVATHLEPPRSAPAVAKSPHEVWFDDYEGKSAVRLPDGRKMIFLKSSGGSFLALLRTSDEGPLAIGRLYHREHDREIQRTLGVSLKDRQAQETTALCDKIDGFLSGKRHDLPFSPIFSATSVDLKLQTRSGEITLSLLLLPMDPSGRSECNTPLGGATLQQRYSWWEDGSIIEECRLGGKKVMTDFAASPQAKNPSVSSKQPVPVPQRAAQDKPTSKAPPPTFTPEWFDAFASDLSRPGVIEIHGTRFVVLQIDPKQKLRDDFDAVALIRRNKEGEGLLFGCIMNKDGQSGEILIGQIRKALASETRTIDTSFVREKSSLPFSQPLQKPVSHLDTFSMDARDLSIGATDFIHTVQYHDLKSPSFETAYEEWVEVIGNTLVSRNRRFPHIKLKLIIPSETSPTPVRTFTPEWFAAYDGPGVFYFKGKKYLYLETSPNVGMGIITRSRKKEELVFDMLAGSAGFRDEIYSKTGSALRDGPVFNGKGFLKIDGPRLMLSSPQLYGKEKIALFFPSEKSIPPIFNEGTRLPTPSRHISLLPPGKTEKTDPSSVKPPHEVWFDSYDGPGVVRLDNGKKIVFLESKDGNLVFLVKNQEGTLAMGRFLTHSERLKHAQVLFHSDVKSNPKMLVEDLLSRLILKWIRGEDAHQLFSDFTLDLPRDGGWEDTTVVFKYDSDRAHPVRAHTIGPDGERQVRLPGLLDIRLSLKEGQAVYEEKSEKGSLVVRYFPPPAAPAPVVSLDAQIDEAIEQVKRTRPIDSPASEVVTEVKPAHETWFDNYEGPGAVRTKDGQKMIFFVSDQRKLAFLIKDPEQRLTVGTIVPDLHKDMLLSRERKYAKSIPLVRAETRLFKRIHNHLSGQNKESPLTHVNFRPSDNALADLFLNCTEERDLKVALRFVDQSGKCQIFDQKSGIRGRFLVGEGFIEVKSFTDYAEEFERFSLPKKVFLPPVTALPPVPTPVASLDAPIAEAIEELIKTRPIDLFDLDLSPRARLDKLTLVAKEPVPISMKLTGAPSFRDLMKNGSADHAKVELKWGEKGTRVAYGLRREGRESFVLIPESENAPRGDLRITFSGERTELAILDESSEIYQWLAEAAKDPSSPNSSWTKQRTPVAVPAEVVPAKEKPIPEILWELNFSADPPTLEGITDQGDEIAIPLAVKGPKENGRYFIVGAMLERYLRWLNEMRQPTDLELNPESAIEILVHGGEILAFDLVQIVNDLYPVKRISLKSRGLENIQETVNRTQFLGGSASAPSLPSAEQTVPEIPIPISETALLRFKPGEVLVPTQATVRMIQEHSYPIELSDGTKRKFVSFAEDSLYWYELEGVESHVTLQIPVRWRGDRRTNPFEIDATEKIRAYVTGSDPAKSKTIRSDRLRVEDAGGKWKIYLLSGHHGSTRVKDFHLSAVVCPTAPVFIGVVNTLDPEKIVPEEEAEGASSKGLREKSAKARDRRVAALLDGKTSETRPLRVADATLMMDEGKKIRLKFFSADKNQEIHWAELEGILLDPEKETLHFKDRLPLRLGNGGSSRIEEELSLVPSDDPSGKEGVYLLVELREDGSLGRLFEWHAPLGLLFLRGDETSSLSELEISNLLEEYHIPSSSGSGTRERSGTEKGQIQERKTVDVDMRIPILPPEARGFAYPPPDKIHREIDDAKIQDLLLDLHDAAFIPVEESLYAQALNGRPRETMTFLARSGAILAIPMQLAGENGGRRYVVHRAADPHFGIQGARLLIPDGQNPGFYHDLPAVFHQRRAGGVSGTVIDLLVGTSQHSLRLEQVATARTMTGRSAFGMFAQLEGMNHDMSRETVRSQLTEWLEFIGLRKVAPSLHAGTPDAGRISFDQGVKVHLQVLRLYDDSPFMIDGISDGQIAYEFEDQGKIESGKLTVFRASNGGALFYLRDEQRDPQGRYATMVIDDEGKAWISERRPGVRHFLSQVESRTFMMVGLQGQEYQSAATSVATRIRLSDEGDPETLIEIRAALGREKGATEIGLKGSESADTETDYLGQQAQVRIRFAVTPDGEIVVKKGWIKSEGGDASLQEAEVAFAEEEGRFYVRGPVKKDQRNVRDYAWLEFPNRESLLDETRFQVARAHYNRTNIPAKQRLGKAH